MHSTRAVLVLDYTTTDCLHGKFKAFVSHLATLAFVSRFRVGSKVILEMLAYGALSELRKCSN